MSESDVRTPAWMHKDRNRHERDIADISANSSFYLCGTASAFLKDDEIEDIHVG